MTCWHPANGVKRLEFTFTYLFKKSNSVWQLYSLYIAYMMCAGFCRWFLGKRSIITKELCNCLCWCQSACCTANAGGSFSYITAFNRPHFYCRLYLQVQNVSTWRLKYLSNVLLTLVLFCSLFSIIFWFCTSVKFAAGLAFEHMLIDR